MAKQQGVILCSEANSNLLNLLDAARIGDVDIVRHLLAEGTDPNGRDILSGYTALYYAATSGHLEIVKTLVESGAKILDQQNTVFQSALAGAVIVGQTDVVVFLLECGADPHERLYGDDASLLEAAKSAGFEEIAALLSHAIEE